jgi:hypothetical protein
MQFSSVRYYFFLPKTKMRMDDKWMGEISALWVILVISDMNILVAE